MSAQPSDLLSMQTTEGQPPFAPEPDEETCRVIKAAPEPFSTILALAAVLGLRIGETLGLRMADIDFAKKLIRVRQSVDSATRTCRSQAS